MMNRTIACILCLAVGSIAHGQGSRQPNDPVYQNRLDLLRTESGQAELHLTDWQRARLTSIQQNLSLRNGVRPDPAKSAEGMAAWAEYMRKNRRDEIDMHVAMLAPWQEQRLRQMSLQMAGPIVLTLPGMPEEFGLSETQLSAIQSLFKEFGQEMRKVGTQGGVPVSALAKPGDPGYMDLPNLATSYAKKMFKVLTPAQRQKWVAMVGRPYDPGSPRTAVLGDPRLITGM